MKNQSPVVLILTKDTASRGGVAGYYNLFFKKVKSHELCYERFTIGSRSKDYYQRHHRILGYSSVFIGDVFRLGWLLVRRHNVRCIQLNPSLISVPLIRDGVLLLLTKVFRRKVVVFVRGWRDDVAEKINNRWWLQKLFVGVFGRADRIIVLAEDFRDQLERIGLPESKIIVSRTMFDGELIQQRHLKHESVPLFLFLSRISREKGVFEILEAAGKLKEAGLQFRIIFHGHGATSNTIVELKEHAEALGVSGYIEVGDFLEGVEKYAAYRDADVFLLPSHHEGCPNSILEALGSGCFVICTGAGAMKEVVRDCVNGRIVCIDDSNDLAEKMSWAINNRQTVSEIGLKNHVYAFGEFESESIINQIVTIHRTLLQKVG